MILFSFFIVIHEGTVPVFLSHSLNVSPLVVLFKMRISECTLALHLSMCFCHVWNYFHYHFYCLKNYLRKQYCPPKMECLKKKFPKSTPVLNELDPYKDMEFVLAMQCWRTTYVPHYTVRLCILCPRKIYCSRVSCISSTSDESMDVSFLGLWW